MKTLIVLLFAISCFLPNLASGTVIKLTSGGNIQMAIDNAQPGDTILLAAGRYEGHDLTIRKPLTIWGESYPVVDGMHKGNIFLVAAENVHFKGLHIINSGKSTMEDSAGIKFFDSKSCTVSDNLLEETYFALHFSNSEEITVSNNRLFSSAEKEYQTGNGIHLWKCKNSTIENNTVMGHRDGIYLEFVTNTVSRQNTIEGNKRYGLHFMFSHDNSYLQNTFRRNGAGVAVMYTHNVLMQENLFEENWGASSYGILLKDITDSQVINNIFRKNTIGIYMEGSSRNTFQNNSFQQNGWAFKLMASCDRNTIEANNFLGNTFDISTNGSVVLNTLNQNYWDKYEGYDLDKDRLGDVPYRPINLFSMIVEKIPAAVILWRSFLVTLLDRMEKVIPSITPENMIDNSPKMKPYDLGTAHS